MKKLVVFLTILVLVFAFGTLGFAKGKIVLHFNTLFHSGDAQAMERIVKLFNETHDNVEIKLTQGQWSQYYAQLYNAVVAGNAPQIGICHTNMLKQMYPALMPLDASPYGNLLEKAGIKPEDYISDLWKAGNYEGHQYLVPLDTHMWGMWYNKDIFKEAGLDPENPPDNGEELRKAAEAIKKTGKYAIHFAENALPRKIRRAWFIFFWQEGGELFDKNYTKATFNNEKGLKALKYLVSSVHEWGWNKPGTDGFKQFAAGELGMLFAGNWYYWTAKNSGVNYGFAYIPNIFGIRKTWGNSHNLVIPKQPKGTDPKVIEEAIKAIKWINEHSYIWGIYGGHIPAYNAARENKELLNSDTWKKSLKKFAEMAENGVLHYPINHPAASKLNNAIQVYIQKAYNGTMSPEDALKAAEKEVNEILKEEQ